jgi:chitodextrinase
MRSVRRAVLVIIAMTAALLVQPSAQAAATCTDSSPTGAYTVRVCITTPDDASTVSGTIPVTATASVVSGTGPGFQRLVFSLNGQYLLTDYSTPYSFNLLTTRFVDGAYSLSVHALLRDTNVTQDTTVSLSFNNGITTPPVNTNTFTPPQGNPVAPGTTFTLAAAGDGAGGEASETAVTNLMASMNPNLTLYLGDVYEKGTPTEFDNWYGLDQPGNTFYGRFRGITLPTIGNHEYTAGQAPGYFDYWDNTPHYYSVDRHGWHIISLDANSAFNQTAPGTAQYDWLASDLNANTQACTLVFYHQPLYNIGDEGPSTYLQPFWQLFAQHGVDLVINGHDHTYQRYVPLDGNGVPSASGVTEIINGAGGHALGAFPGSDSRLVASAQQFGALQLGLNSAGASYQFLNTSGVVVDNGSAKCDTTTADNVSPSTPTNLAATGTYKTQIDLSWTPSTDNVGVTQYRIFRDGALLDTVAAASSYSDTTVTPGSTHSYVVRAVDSSGNASGASNTASATTPTVAVLFHDGFESGDMSNWQNPGGTTNPPNAGLSVQSSDVFAGSYAARAYSSDGSYGSAAWKTLSQQETNLYYMARFKANSHSTSVNLIRMRAGNASSSPIATVGLSTTNKLTLRNDGGVTPATTTSTTGAAPGVWHTVQLHVTVNGTASSTEVWLDGTQVTDLSKTLDLGSSAIAKVELGDPGSATTAKTFDIDFDEVAFDRDFIGDLTAPTAPSNLTATPHSGLAVDLAWTAATDDVGIAGYDIYRNGSLLTSVGNATSYRDSSVTPNASYTYKLIARDVAGNASGYSNSATVQTGDIFADGFETGDLSKWSSVSGLTASQALVDTGTWGARSTSDGTSGASAQVTLDAGVSDLYYRLRFQKVSQGAVSVNLARLRTSTNAAIATAFVSSTGRLGYRNDLTGISTTSPAPVSAGAWHELQFHVTVAGGSSQVELWLDGVNVMTQADSLGTAPIGRLELGETSTSKTFDYAYDNVFASPSFVVDNGAPSAPTNLQVTGMTNSSVSLSWDPATDDVGVVDYRIYRDGSSIGDVDGATTTYTDATSVPNQSYTYKVYALDAVGHQSPASNSVSVDTPDTQAPNAPTGLTGHAVAGANEIDLSWNAATDNRGVTGYKVYRSGQAGAIATLGTTLSFADTTVASATTYTYTVTALDGAGNESPASAGATVTTSDTVAPTSPGAVSATAVSDSSITVTWGASTDAGGVAAYDVFRSGVANSVGSVSGSTLTFTDTGLAADTAYTYTVKARDAAGNVSAASSASPSTSTMIFSDGFETGTLSRWNAGGSLSVQSALTFSGTYGAQATSNKNTAVFAVKTLPATYADVTYDVRVFLNTGKSGNTDVLRFQNPTGGNLLSLVYTNNKKLAYFDDVTGKLVTSTVSVPVGAWQEAKVRLQVSGTTSRVTVWFNGTQVAALTGTASLGTNTAVGRIVAGESSTGNAYDFALDDVRITRTP